METMITAGPVTRARERVNLSMAALSRATGTSYTALSRAEAGLATRVSPSVLAALEAVCGADPAEVQADYRRWRESLREGT